ncbi:MAG TPA: DUF6600 domain-containing protein [Vicinamibacteria bacterium]|nr:DUF6600 domain-containing protein [Vicinamibacteria bacterium]
MSRHALRLAVLATALPTLAVAEETYRHGRVRHTEAGVSLQRATEPGAEEAVPNLPFLPGDRVWSDARGRIEFQFADGTILRLDSGSKLDYVAHEEDADDERVILRLWSGALTLHTRDGRASPEFAVETPGGVLVADARGVYRVDVDSGETRVSVYDGEAVLEADRRIRVRAGERVYARAGEAYGDAERFDVADADGFTRWDADRQGQIGVARNVPEYLPEDISPYAGELEDHGAWYYEAEIGHVWRPQVDAGWRPYHNGRWIWTSYGYTWLPYEQWGWAPFHYGRWDHAPALGWYWIPGGAWGPAWVNWAIGGDYVGWCPMGWRDREVRHSRDRGWAVPRGHSSTAWVYARRGDLAARDLPQRVALDTAVPRNMTIVEPSRSHLTRDLRVVDAPSPASGTSAVPRAVPRNVRTNPGPGHTTPELRSDPATTIPFPTPRRRYENARERDAEREAGRGVRSSAPVTGETSDGALSAPAGTRPDTTRPFPSTARPRAPRPDSRERSPDADARAPETDRDVMRPVFRPLSRPRPEVPSQGDAGARRPAEPERSSARPERSTPRPERSAPSGTRTEPRQERAPAGASAAPPPAAGGGDRARSRREN